MGLTMFDLRRRGKVGKLSMVGTSGSKFPAIRESNTARLQFTDCENYGWRQLKDRLFSRQSAYNSFANVQRRS